MICWNEKGGGTGFSNGISPIEALCSACVIISSFVMNFFVFFFRSFDEVPIFFYWLLRLGLVFLFFFLKAI